MQYYNKFRPKILKHIVGQKSLKEILISMLQRYDFFPVIVLSGPKGTGKTSISRIMAKMLNCKDYLSHQLSSLTRDEKESAINLLPCNKCESCVLIENKQSLDILEIDGATYTGVDNTREIIEGAYHLPILCKTKIIIIDEVHMLSKGSFNSLLKTFEEPPEHVKFFLLTTEEEKIPETVLSRSLMIKTQTVSEEEVVKFLLFLEKEINLTESHNKDEKHKRIPIEVLELIGKSCNGSMRNAIVSFESLFFLKKYDLRSVTRSLNTCSITEIMPLYTSLLEGDVKKAVELFKDLKEDGVLLWNFLHLLLKLIGTILKSNMEIEDQKKNIEFFSSMKIISNNLLIRHWEIIIYQLMNMPPIDDLVGEMLLIMLSTVVEEDASHSLLSLERSPGSWSGKVIVE
jgi:DNA polymerase-3 subunit gamma/tau